MMDNLEKIYLTSYLIYNFENVKNDTVFKNFVNLLKNILKEEIIEKNIEAYISFISSLKNTKSADFSLHLNNLILKNEINNNEEDLEKELNIISTISKISYQDIKNILSKKFPKQATIFENLPKYSNNEFDFSIKNLTSKINTKNEFYEEHKAFIFDNDFEIKPLKFSENINFNSLKGYEKQKKVLFDNTNSLLLGNKVNNILLYGDAGCGKSSSVRALLNEFENLKIIQIFKNNLINLDKLYLKLESLPYKFIIFADDISFDESDEIFSTMKAIIEGSLIQCPNNVAIYATSNRRHLIKESHSSRFGDEIHLKDTINETSSLSERFGINLFFEKPSNDEFNRIVIELAKDNNIKIDEKTLIEKAQRLALIKGTRSPRIAKQLIDNLIAHIEI